MNPVFILLHKLNFSFFLAYLGGAVFAVIYNDLIYLFRSWFEKKKIKICFIFDPNQKINIIKSPVEGEALIDDETNEKIAKLTNKHSKLYDFDPLPEPARPYTIVFVANSKILVRNSDEDAPDRYIPDPIMENPGLFLYAVNQALVSFERDEIMGQPAIWSRIRVVAIFDPQLAEQDGGKYGMLREFPEDRYLDDSMEPIDNNLLSPRYDMADNLQNIFDLNGYTGLSKEDVDVIFAVSASMTHDRAMSIFADLSDDMSTVPSLTPADYKDYDFDYDPYDLKKTDSPDSTQTAILDPVFSGSTGYRKVHEYRPIIPGRVAINVHSARIKTYIHEFAHAMSSFWNGRIVDEYYDFMHDGPTDTGVHNPERAFTINRIQRNAELMQTTYIPVHKEFARFEQFVYASDLNHLSAKENWISYFPERSDNKTCTMDRSGDVYRFDQLISAFIYQRMQAKLYRS